MIFVALPREPLCYTDWVRCMSEWWTEQPPNLSNGNYGNKGFLFQESFGITRTGENKLSNYRLICTTFSVENVARRRIWLSSWKVYCRIVQECFPKLQFFSLQYSVACSIQALCPVFSRHVSLRYLSDSKRLLYREILPELPTCTREIHDGWRASGANEPFLGSHYSLLGTKYSFRGTKLVFRDNNESLLGAKLSLRGTKLVFRDTNKSLLEAKHSFRGTTIVSEDTNEMLMIQNEIQMPIGETMLLGCHNAQSKVNETNS